MQIRLYMQCKLYVHCKANPTHILEQKHDLVIDFEVIWRFRDLIQWCFFSLFPNIQLLTFSVKKSWIVFLKFNIQYLFLMLDFLSTIPTGTTYVYFKYSFSFLKFILNWWYDLKVRHCIALTIVWHSSKIKDNNEFRS